MYPPKPQSTAGASGWRFPAPPSSGKKKKLQTWMAVTTERASEQESRSPSPPPKHVQGWTLFSSPLPSPKKKEKRVVLRVCFPHFPLFWISAMNEWIFFLPSFQLVREGLIVLFFFLRNYVSRFGWDWVTRIIRRR